MKLRIALAVAYLIGIWLLTGCAHFQTTQTETYTETNNVVVTRSTTVSAFTLFTATSELSKFRASQTDKTQSATVGSLGLSSTNDMAATIQALANLVTTLRPP